MKKLIHLFVVLLSIFVLFLFCFEFKEGREHVASDHVRLTHDRFSEWLRAWKAKEKEDSALTADRVLSGTIFKIFTRLKGLALDKTGLACGLGRLLQTAAGS